MGSEDGRAELRGLYTDPARPLTVAVGQAFDLVSMPAAVGHAALTALRARRVRLGPVVADSRRAVMRVGFLVAPARGMVGAAGAELETGNASGSVPMRGLEPGLVRGPGLVSGRGLVPGPGPAPRPEPVSGPVPYGASRLVGQATPTPPDGRTADPDSVALGEWADRLGGTLGVRVGGPGSTAILPPLLPWRGWLHWLVPPGGAAERWTPCGALLAVLSNFLAAPDCADQASCI